MCPHTQNLNPWGACTPSSSPEGREEMQIRAPWAEAREASGEGAASHASCHCPSSASGLAAGELQATLPGATAGGAARRPTGGVLSDSAARPLPQRVCWPGRRPRAGASGRWRPSVPWVAGGWGCRAEAGVRRVPAQVPGHSCPQGGCPLSRSPQPRVWAPKQEGGESWGAGGSWTPLSSRGSRSCCCLRPARRRAGDGDRHTDP